MAIDPHHIACIDIPQPERDGDLAIRQFLERADDETVSLDDLPVGKTRLDVDRQILLDEGGRVLHLEQASRFEVVAHNVGDLAGELGVRAAADFEVRDGQRRRLEIAAAFDQHFEFGRGGRRQTNGGGERHHQGKQQAGHGIPPLNGSRAGSG